MKRLYALSFCLMLFVACDNDDLSNNDTLCDPTPVFDIDLFIENIENEMQSTSTSGYQIVVNQNGQLYYQNANGFAIHESDPGGQIAMTTNTRINIASVSKFVGTIALMNALEDNTVSTEFNLVNYLPESWRNQVHPEFSNVDNDDAYLTFKKLLTMDTAINFVGATPSPGSMLSEEDMLLSLTLAPNPARRGIYQNANFTLIRVLIGEMVFNLDETDPNYATLCTEKYFEYIKQRIFDPLGINAPLSPAAVNSYYASNSYALGYQWPFNPNFQNPSDGSLGWQHTSNPYLNGGSGGLILSALDLAELLAFFKYDNQNLIISSEQRDKILSGSPLGLTESIFQATHGTYYVKQGTRGPDNCCDRALRSTIMFFPNDVEVVLLSNSNRNGMRTLLENNYDNAYVNPCI